MGVHLREGALQAALAGEGGRPGLAAPSERGLTDEKMPR
jgi:miniconductance mechanosensitive channel